MPSIDDIRAKVIKNAPPVSAAQFKKGQASVFDGTGLAPWPNDADPTIASMRTLGTDSTQAMPGDTASLPPTGESVVDASIVAGGLSYNKVKTRQIATARITANVTISSTTGPSSGTSIVALGNQTYDGSAVNFDFSCPGLQITSGTVARRVLLWLCDETASVGIGAVAVVYAQVANVLNSVPVSISVQITPSAGTHNYSIRGQKDNAADTATVLAGSLSTGYVNTRLTATYA